MRVAISNAAYAAAAGLPLVAVALLVPHPRSGQMLAGGLMVLALGAAAFLYFWRQGQRADRNFGDERESAIAAGSTKATFWVMAVAVQLNWAYTFARYGNGGDSLAFALMLTFWGSFLAANLYYRVRL